MTPRFPGDHGETVEKVLLISNIHREDTIAGKGINRLKPAGDFQTYGWPMVGAGAPYSARNIPMVGAKNLLHSCGFRTASLKMSIQDLRSGIRQSCVGNPMMDGFEDTGETFGLTTDKIVIGLLPGRRKEEADNALHQMRVTASGRTLPIWGWWSLAYFSDP